MVTSQMLVESVHNLQTLNAFSLLLVVWSWKHLFFFCWLYGMFLNADAWKLVHTNKPHISNISVEFAKFHACKSLCICSIQSVLDIMNLFSYQVYVTLISFFSIRFCAIHRQTVWWEHFNWFWVDNIRVTQTTCIQVYW